MRRLVTATLVVAGVVVGVLVEGRRQEGNGDHDDPADDDGHRGRLTPTRLTGAAG